MGILPPNLDDHVWADFGAKSTARAFLFPTLLGGIETLAVRFFTNHDQFLGTSVDAKSTGFAPFPVYDYLSHISPFRMIRNSTRRGFFGSAGA
jgi:hypothetical protein